MIHARETKLLTAERCERMIAAPSVEEAAKILTDCGYEDMSGMDAAGINEALNAHRTAVFKELAQLCPEKNYLDIFAMRYDYHNAKVLIKAEAMNSDAAVLMSDSGRFPAEKLRKLFYAGSTVSLPEIFGNALKDARQMLESTGNPQLADFILDRAYFAEMTEAANGTQNSFLQEYVRLLADCANLKSAVRTLRLKKGKAFLLDALNDSGSVRADKIASALSPDGILSVFGGTALSSAAALGAEAAAGGTLTAFELACDNAVNAFLKRARRVNYGSEPLTGYIAAVENEITAVRMILTGRLAGVKSDVLRERLRDMYA